jgi:phosphoenolpyruvate carboxykinase (ATP)
MEQTISLEQYGFSDRKVLRNLAPAKLYTEALTREQGTIISSTGGLVAMSGEKTGRTPKDKRLVEDNATKDDICWGDINIPFSQESFISNKKIATDFLDQSSALYVVDGYVGWDPKYRLKVRVICARAYHALFMWNMLIRPNDDELEAFGEPDYVIFNAGQADANPEVQGVTSKASVAINFASKELVILGTQYAGEMKKGVFSIMNYLMPKNNVLSMHCSANEGANNNVSIFFGLSGTGKTTLSADANRKLIGDDEHCWSDDGVFNIEGGCYAKCINLSAEKEPEIFEAIRFGAILENVIYDERTHVIDYDNTAITQNTRTSYPIEHIPNAKIPCIGGHPEHIILLTCDAFGVLPPVSRLTPAQAMYHFISGYTAKVAGTEMGVVEPEATFSACFGAAFMVWHPTKYAELLADKMRQHGSKAWLVNTGWSGGGHGTGSRMDLAHTRAIIDAIHNGELENASTQNDAVFGFDVPTSCSNVPGDILLPKNTWANPQDYDNAAQKLAGLFAKNFQTYASQASEDLLNAGPH